MAEHLRTFGVVALITLLVWAFAEGESLRSTSVTMRVSLGSDSPNLVVTLAEDEFWDGSVEVRMDGPTARLDAVRAELRRIETVELTTRELGTESGPVRLADALRSHPIFRDSGVSIVDADPSTIQIEVDRLVQRDAAVVVDPGGVPVRGLAQPNPSSVPLRIPERLERELGDAIELVVRLDDQMVEGLTPGQAQTIFNIPSAYAAGLERLREVLGEPPRVDVTLTLAVRRETRTMASVPVVVSMPSVVSDQYIARLPEQDQFLVGLELRGPVGIFEQVGPGRRFTPRVDAFLNPELLAAQVPSDGAEAELSVTGTLTGVPVGVEPTQELPAVRVFVRRLVREADPPAGGEG